MDRQLKIRTMDRLDNINSALHALSCSIVAVTDMGIMSKEASFGFEMFTHYIIDDIKQLQSAIRQGELNG